MVSLQGVYAISVSIFSAPTIAVQASLRLLPCLPGTALDRASGVCTDCPPGAFSSSFGAADCTLCSPGYALALAGQTQCGPCSPVNQICHLLNGAQPAFQGFFADRNGTRECSPCAARSVAPRPAASACIVCPDFASAVAGACACQSAFAYDNTSNACVACAAGIDCDQSGQVSVNCT